MNIIKDEQDKPEEKKPVKINRPFLHEKKGWTGKQQPVEELQEYVLFLIKNNGHMDLIENVSAGEFYLKSKDGKQEKTIILSANKLLTINYNKQYFKGWVAHEDNVTPYPQDPLFVGEMYRKTVQKLAMNYRDANEAKYLEAKAKMWIWITLGVIAGAYIIFLLGKGQGWWGGDATAITQVTADAMKNISTSVGVTVG